MANEPPTSGEIPSANPSATFDRFDDFVKQAIKDYYDLGWRARKANLVGLLIASGQTVALAKDSLSGPEGLRRAAIGAASLVALRVGLGFALTGPLGLLVTGLAGASLVAFFLKNQKEITAKLPRFHALLDEARAKFEEIQAGYRQNRYSAQERNLMVDGLLKRFLADCDGV